MMNLEDLALCNKKAIRLAGPRFSPGIDPEAPDIQIHHLIDAIDALSLAKGFRDQLKKYAKDLEKVSSKFPNPFRLPLMTGPPPPNNPERA